MKDKQPALATHRLVAFTLGSRDATQSGPNTPTYIPYEFASATSGDYITDAPKEGTALAG